MLHRPSPDSKYQAHPTIPFRQKPVMFTSLGLAVCIPDAVLPFAASTIATSSTPAVVGRFAPKESYA